MIVFNLPRRTNPKDSNPFKLDRSCLVFANRSISDNKITILQADQNSKCTGKFVVCAHCATSPSIFALALLWVPEFLDFASLLSLADLDPKTSCKLVGDLGKFDSQILHSDIPALVQKLSAQNRYFAEPVILGGGLISMDHKNKVIFIGFGSSKGVLPKLFLDCVFYDLAKATGYSIFSFSDEKGSVTRGSPEDVWFKRFGNEK